MKQLCSSTNGIRDGERHTDQLQYTISLLKFIEVKSPMLQALARSEISVRQIHFFITHGENISMEGQP